MTRRITTVSAREMPNPPDAVLEAVWEIKNIEQTEVKADRVEVRPVDPRRGSYRALGRFAGKRWNDEFEYELNEGGFHSRNGGALPERATIEGGFIVTQLAGGCTVIHYEQYMLPTKLAPLTPLIRFYLRWSMRRELRDLERLVADNGLTAPVTGRSCRRCVGGAGESSGQESSGQGVMTRCPSVRATGR